MLFDSDGFCVFMGSLAFIGFMLAGLGPQLTAIIVAGAVIVAKLNGY